MAVQIQYRRGTAAQWSTANTVLASGEPGYETDTGKFKVGDGVTAWTPLSYSSGSFANISVGTVTTLNSGSSATVTNTGTTNVLFNFGIPRGTTIAANSTVVLGNSTISPSIATTSNSSFESVLTFTIPRGNTGTKGGMKYVANTTTTQADPGLGTIRFSSATYASVSNLYFDYNEFEANANLAGYISTWSASTSNVKGYLEYVSNSDSGTTLGVFQINGVTDSTGYFTVNVTPIGTGTVPSSNEVLAFRFIRTGDKGNTGPYAPKSIVIPYPSASENTTFFYTNSAITVNKISSIVRGTTGQTVTFSIRWASDRSAVGTEVITGGTVASNGTTGLQSQTFNSAAISGNSWVWITTTAATANTTELHLTVEYI